MSQSPSPAPVAPSRARAEHDDAHISHVAASRIMPLAVLFIIGFLYLLTAPNRYTIGDPVHEIGYAIADTVTIRPNHLISSPVNMAVISALGVENDATARMIALECLFIFATLFTGYFVYRTGRSLGADRVGATIAMALVLLFNGVWTHATTVESGAIPTALLAASVYMFVRRPGTAADAAAAGALFALGVLFNFQHVLLVPVAAVLSFASGGPARQRARRLGIAIVMMATVGLGAYLALGWPASGASSPGEFAAWVTTNPESKFLGHMSLGVDAALRSISGLISLAVNTHGGTSAAKVMMQNRPEVLVDRSVFVYLAAGGAVAALVVWLGWLGRRASRAMALGSALALVTVLLFGMFWLGSDPQFWLPIVPFAGSLAAVGISRLRERRAALVTSIGAALALALAALNAPLREPSIAAPKGDATNHAALLASEQLPRQSVVITPGSRFIAVLGMLRPDIDVIDLVRDTLVSQGDFPAGEGDSLAVLASLSQRVSSAVAVGRAVYAEGLTGKVPLEQVGNWEIIDGYRHLRRDNVRGHIAREYGLAPVELPGNVDLARVQPRTEAP